MQFPHHLMAAEAHIVSAYGPDKATMPSCVGMAIGVNNLLSISVLRTNALCITNLLSRLRPRGLLFGLTSICVC